MEKQFYRVTVGDSAVNLKTKPENYVLSEGHLTQLNEALPSDDALGLQITSIEKVTRESDFDMDDSRKWMVNLDVTLVINSDEATISLLKPYQVVSDQLNVVTSLLDRIAKILPGSKLNYSGEWVVSEFEPASDYEPASAAPKF